MKKIILLLLIIMPLISFAREEGTWDFPYTVENGGLKKLKSYVERVDACQIPVDLIANIPTSNLAKLCLDYPLFETMTAHNNLQTGYNQVASEFNGFDELFNRGDAGDALVALYKSYKINTLDSMKTPIDVGRYRASIFHLEFLISDDRIIEKLKDNQIQELLSEALMKLEKKTKRNVPIFQIQSTPLLMARIMDFKNFDGYTAKKLQSPKYDYFTKAVHLSEADMIDDIKNMTIEYLSIVE